MTHNVKKFKISFRKKKSAETEYDNKDKNRGGGQRDHQTAATNIHVLNKSDKLLMSHDVLVFGFPPFYFG